MKSPLVVVFGAGLAATVGQRYPATDPWEVSDMRFVRPVVLVAVLGGGMLAAVPAAGAAATPPHIVAQPDNLMVNTYTTLTGSGFPADTVITIKECGVRSWSLPENPCASNNAIRATTDPAGGFVSGFKAELCPDGVTGPLTEETCYIGEPKPSGVDTIRLVGAAKIVVTYP